MRANFQSFTEYQVDEFDGEKSFYISQVLPYGFFGGQNPTVGIVLLFQGLTLIVIGVALLAYYVKNGKM